MEEAITNLEPGQWVTCLMRWSDSMKCIIPGFSGVVRAVRPELDEVDIVEFGSHGTRTARLTGTRAMRGRSKQMEKHITEFQEMPRFRHAGGRDMAEYGASDVSLGELMVERYLINLTREAKERKTMAKTTTKTTAVSTPAAQAEPKAPKARKGKAQSLAGLTPEDFFVENAKGKSVFKPGFDAKFAACLKRVAQGTADADDRRLAKSKTILNHPKVVESAHFQHLLQVVERATAA